ncbi:MAG: TetR/AcrR family transcriptional regulator [Fulvimarina manganoxydans]|uniref:TetR/AcrR family transcriptional regulator n=1 Tax=Fulvimarina manganoxydans TaxID=937218 RepID=UPI002355D765|nr:TetR/AcrR family transcriptional regulator [Fulvimarina manganoxydans]MCK5933478.1 TetR/AcrR family transcriptional regulator [Fulvimarina manganoxydans]
MKNRRETEGEEGRVSTPGRKMRADSIRNRERLIEAAADVFRTGGGEASLEAVARKAGVGIGTLYRHFPKRDALFEAVYRREVAELADLADHLAESHEPVEAVRLWLHANVGLVATKKGMLAALAIAADGRTELYAESFERLTRAVGGLITAAVESGAMRPDISAEEVLWALIGMCHMRNQPGWQSGVLKLVDVFVDGLRMGSGAEPSGAKV